MSPSRSYIANRTHVPICIYHTNIPLPELNLQANSQLNTLHLNLNLGLQEPHRTNTRPAIVLHWFESVCKSITSQSIRIRLDGAPSTTERCNRVEDALLSVQKRSQDLAVYLSGSQKANEQLFPRLYQVGIVTDEYEASGWG